MSEEPTLVYLRLLSEYPDFSIVKSNDSTTLIITANGVSYYVGYGMSLQEGILKAYALALARNVR